MALSLARWRPRHLLAAWSAYWLVLLVWAARPALVSALRAVSAPEGHGTMSATVDDGVLKLLVKTDGLSYVGSLSMMSAALWITVPPLVLWILWLVTRPRPVAARERAL